MAVELATAYVNIVPSARGFGAALRRDLEGAGAEAGDAASASFGSRLTAGVARAAKLAAVGIAGLAAAATGFGLKIAAGNETAQISFETMLGSADKAGVFLKDLKRFAATTPFEFPELQTAAGSLISIGVDASKVIPIMTTLGNVTSGMGTGAEGVKRATVAIQQMNAAGRITAQDLNQLRDAGIPVFELLAGATGKSKEELAGMAQNGKLGRQELEQLMKALETGKGLERFNGLMEKQSASLKGIISTLKDTLGQGLADAVAPAIGPLKESLLGLSDALGEQLTTWGPIFAGALAGLVTLISQLLGAVMPILGSFVALFASVMAGIGPILVKLTPPIVAFAQVLATALNGALDELLPSLGYLLGALVPLLGPLGQLAGVLIGQLGAALADMAFALVPVVRLMVGAFAPILTRAAELLPAVTDALAPFWRALGLVAQALAPVAGVLLGAMLDAVEALLPVLPGLSDALGVIVDVIVALAPHLVSLLPLVVLIRALAPVVGALGASLGALLTALAPIGGALVEGLVRIVEALVPLLPTLVDSVLLLVDALIQALPQLTPLIPLLVDLALLVVPLAVTVLDLVNALLRLEGAAQIVIGLWVAFQLFGLVSGIVSAVSGALGVLTGFLTAMGLAVLPVVAVVAAIAAVVVGLVLLYNKWQPFRDLVDGFVDSLRAAIEWVREFASALFSWDTDRLLAMLSGLGDTITGWVTGTLVPFLTEAAPRLAGAFLAWIADMAPQIGLKLLGLIAAFTVWYYTVAIPWLVTNGAKLAAALLGWLVGLVPIALEKLGGLLQAIGSWIAETAVPWLIEKAASLAVGLLLWLVKVQIEMPVYLARLLLLIGGWIVAAVPWLIEKALALRAAITSWLIDAALALPGLLAGFATSLIEFIAGLPDRVTDAAKNMFVGITNAWLAALNWIIRTWNDFKLVVPEVEILGQKFGGFTLDTPNVPEAAYLTGFAAGGRPPTDRPSLVGEAGPELFWPDRAGTIVPNAGLAGAPGGAGGLTVGSVTVIGAPRPAETAFAIRSELRYLSMAAGGT